MNVSKCLGEASVLFGLMAPVLAAQAAQMALGVVDTVMTGRYGAADMAAVGLGWAVWLPLLLFGLGLLVAVVPAVGHLRGAGREGTEEIRQVVRQGVWLGVLTAVPVAALVVLLSYRLTALGVPPELAGIAGRYLRLMMLGALPCFLYASLHFALEGYAVVRPAMVAGIVGLLANIPVNYGFIYGRLGLPELGGAGAGAALAVTYWVLFAVGLMYAWRHPDIGPALRSLGLPKAAPLRRLFAVGLPNALASLNEGGLFSVVTMFAAPFGTTVVAGHNVAMNVSSLIFLLPLSVSIAATIRVSHGVGSGDAAAVRLTTRAAMGMGLACAVATAAVTVLFRHGIVGLYNGDPGVAAVAAALLLIDAAYQMTDAFQVVSVGILRGYNDTRAIFAVTFVCFWIVTVPLAYLAGRTDVLFPAAGVYGLWWSLVFGLTLAAVCYGFRMRILEKRMEENKS